MHGSASGLTVNDATLALEDDDTASTSALSPASASATIEVTAARRASHPEATSVTVTVGAAGDAAASGTDYQAVSDFVLTIARSVERGGHLHADAG